MCHHKHVCSHADAILIHSVTKPSLFIQKRISKKSSPQKINSSKSNQLRPLDTKKYRILNDRMYEERNRDSSMAARDLQIANSLRVDRTPCLAKRLGHQKSLAEK